MLSVLLGTTRMSIARQSSGQQLSYVRESSSEPPVVRTQPQKTPQLVFVSRSWPVFHSFNFSVSVVTPDVKMMCPMYLLPQQLALLGVHFQAWLSQPLEHLLQIVELFLKCVANDNDVIQVY